MRLIDAEGEYSIEASDNTGYKIECKNGIALLSDKYGYIICEFMIDDVPTAYDVDKVVEQLKEYAHGSICRIHEHGCPYLTNDNVSCENCGAIGALEIVKSGGIRKRDKIR